MENKSSIGKSMQAGMIYSHKMCLYFEYAQNTLRKRNEWALTKCPASPVWCVHESYPQRSNETVFGFHFVLEEICSSSFSQNCSLEYKIFVSESICVQ